MNSCLQRLAIGGAVCAFLLGGGSAYAACPGTVAAGENLNTTQNLAVGEDCVVEDGGSVVVADPGGSAFGINGNNQNNITNNGNVSATDTAGGGGATGIETDDDSSVTNTGTASGTDFDGGTARGIDVRDRSTVTNTGTVNATDFGTGGAVGIDSRDDASITNEGTVNAVDEDAGNATGIDVRDGGTVSNSGTVNATNSGTGTAFGINARDDASITNNGTVTGVDNDAGSVDGIDARDDSTITNNGTVSVTNNGAGTARGVDVRDNNTITNTGDIVVSNPGGGTAEAIDARESNTVINSGLIKATSNGGIARAIDFVRGTNELVLRRGSTIIGSIALGDDFDQITFENAVSTVLTFEDDGNGVPEGINTNGLPFVVSGTTVAVLDPSALNQFDEMLSGLTSGIFNSIHARMAGTAGSPGAGSGPMALGFGAPMYVTGGSGGEVVSSSSSGGVWMQGFGGILNQDGSGATHGATHKLAGGMVGVDGSLLAGVRIGAFAGGARDKLEVEFSGDEVETDSYFGGGYATFRQGGFFASAMIVAGRTKHDSERTVFYNLSSTGIQLGAAEYDGTFVSPELAVGATMGSGWFRIEPSARIRYAHLSLDGYTETGAIDALSVGDRDISLWQGRLQVAFPMRSRLPNGGVGTLSPRIGVEGRTSDNDSVSAVVLGQAISFNPGGDDEEVTGFAGVTLNVATAGGLEVFADAELHAGEDGIARSEARLGVTIGF